MNERMSDFQEREIERNGRKNTSLRKREREREGDRTIENGSWTIKNDAKQDASSPVKKLNIIHSGERERERMRKKKKKIIKQLERERERESKCGI